MNGHDITRVVKSFNDLDAASRVEYIVNRPEDERWVIMAYLLDGTHQELLEIKRDRRWMYGAGHLAAIVLGGFLGIFGQPLRP